MSQKVEDLLVELQKKENELVLAASYGKALLEEKEHLRNDLQAAHEEIKQLEEDLQTQKHESQRSLLQTKAEADELMLELEQRLHSTKESFQTEQNRHNSTKEEHQKALRGLHVENSKLRAQISVLKGEKDDGDERVRKVSDALKESEAQGQVASHQQEELEEMIETLQGTNRSFSEEVSTLTYTCDRLSEELQQTRAQLESWETRYTHLNEEFACQHKELEDSQEIVKQLEAEIDRQRSMAAPSPTSTMSLHDELSQSMNSLDMIPGTISPLPTVKEGSLDKVDTMVENLPTDHEEQVVPDIEVENPFDSVKTILRRPSEQSVTSTLKRSDFPSQMLMWSSFEDRESPCPECMALGEKVAKYEQELRSVNEQLIVAVQQKLKLQEQNEAWQSDMEELVQQNLHQKLEQEAPNDKPTLSNKPESPTKSKKKKLTSTNKDNYDTIFKQEFIKKSWLF